MARQTRRRRGAPKGRVPSCPQVAKVRYNQRNDATQALTVARRLRGRAELQGQTCTLRVDRSYHCQYCDGWHLTSKPDRNAGRRGTDSTRV